MTERATYDARLGELADDLDELLERSDALLSKEWRALRDESWLPALVEALDAAEQRDRALVWAEQRKRLRAALGKTKALASAFRGVLDEVGEAEEEFASLLGVEVSNGARRARHREEFAELLRDKASDIERATRRAVLTGDEDLIEHAHRTMGGASKSIDLALHEVPMRFSRDQAVAHAEAAGAERFKYFGPKDSVNRRFCRERVGKVYSRDDIESMDNGQGTNAFEHCGGWRCRHHWRPVRRAGAPSREESNTEESLDDFFDRKTQERLEELRRRFPEGDPDEIVEVMAQLREELLTRTTRRDFSDYGIELEIDDDLFDEAREASLRDHPEGTTRQRADVSTRESLVFLMGDAPDDFVYPDEIELRRDEVTNSGVTYRRIYTVLPNKLALVSSSRSGVAGVYSHRSLGSRLVEEREDFEERVSEAFPRIGMDSVDTSTVMHEMGHWFEQRNRRALQAAERFLLRRSGGRLIEYSDGFYETTSEEWAYDGNFYDKYVGYQYRSRIEGRTLRGTEVLAMGIEYFTDPRMMRNFWRKDPEHFAHVIAVMRGDFGYETAEHWER